MKRLILTLAVMTTIVSCNKEEIVCDCETVHEKSLFGSWYSDTDDNYNPIITTTNDCGMHNDTTYTASNKRQITTCK